MRAAAASAFLIVAALAMGRAAHAEAARTHVSVRLAGDPASIEATTAVLRERIDNVGFKVDVAPVPAIDRASILERRETAQEDVAAIWIDATNAEKVTLLLVDVSGDRVLVREVARGLNPEVTSEELGHIVEAALGALKAGERIGVERTTLALASAPKVDPPPPALPPPPAPEAPPPPAPPPPVRIGLDASAFYLVRSWGDGMELSSGPGLTVGLERRTERLRSALMFAGEYRFPSTIASERASLRFESGAIHLLAQSDVAVVGRSWIGAAVGGGIEVMQAEARDLTGANVTVTSAGERSAIVPSLRGMVRYVLSTPILRGYAGLGVDVPLRNTRYAIQGLAEPVVLFEPWGARPFLVVGVELP